MLKPEPKYRWPLNHVQVEVLELLYKFRFVTVPTVRDYFLESYPGMNVFKKLERLESQGFIAKRYLDNFELLHKPVVYYLLPDGSRELREYRAEDDVDEVNIQGIYRDGIVSEQFALHCIAVFRLYNRLSVQYGESLGFFSRSDQKGLEGFPKPLPDAYVTFSVADETISHYFMDVVDDDMHLMAVVSQRMKRYISYARSGEWGLMQAPFPTLIFVCNSEDLCSRVQKRCEGMLNRAWLLDVTFKAVTIGSIEL